MLALAWILLTLPAVLPASGQQVLLCLENQKQLSAGALDSFRDTLRELGPLVGATIAFRCEDLRPPFVIVTLRQEPRLTQPDNAMAAMRTQDGRVLPRMELYLKPIHRLLPARLEVLEGRALAWVAGHELLHFLSQRQHHDHRGWFAAELNTAMLLLPPSAYRQK